MNSLVLDNSVAMRWCFKDGSDTDLAYAEKVLDSLSDTLFLVPNLWHLEAVNVLVRAEKRLWLNSEQTQLFLALVMQLPIQVDTATAGKAMTTTLTLARECNLSAYDAAYLELALRFGVPLATLDVNLRKAAVKVGVLVFACQD